MAIIIDKPGFGERLGSSFGTGLGRALEGLAENKFRDMLRMQQAQRTARGLGSLFPQQQAESLGELDPLILREVLKQELPRVRESQLSSLLENILSSSENGILQEEVRTQPSSLDQFAQLLKTPSGLRSPLQIKKEEISVQKAPFSGVSEKEQTTYEKQLSDEIEKIRGGLQRKDVDPSQKKQLRLLLGQKQSELGKISKDLRKEVKADLVAAREKAVSADSRIKSLERLQELEDRSLIGPGLNEFLTRSGLDIGALKNPESDEAQAIIQGFARDAKTFFGGRVSNFEVEQFMKALPNLSQSPEGRKRIIARLKDFARLEKATYDEARNVIRKNANIPPADLWERVDDSLDSQREKFARLLKQDLKRKVPTAESSLKTAAGAIAGSLAKPLTKAAIGGLIGSAIPAIGTAGGAALGGLSGLFNKFNL